MPKMKSIAVTGLNGETPHLPAGENRVSVVEGDCVEVLRATPAGTYDAVITDPPYPGEFRPVVEAALREIPRVMKDNSEALILIGHIMLPWVIDIAREGGLEYWWTAAMRLTATPVTWKYGVINSWKPALWFVKGKKKRRAMASDMPASNRPEQAMHKWEQGVLWFEHWCERCCDPDGLILDPFGGAGTTAIAAMKTGRRCVLIERDPRSAQTCRDRLAGLVGTEHDRRVLTVQPGHAIPRRRL
jgi:16S rRNA G966 N2-methylase RsmD